MTLKVGSYPGGFHLENFTERYTNQGAEATIVFLGPSQNRWTLLGVYFPRWDYTFTAWGDVCCADYVVGSGPKSYAEDFLWPDTFTVEPYDPNTCTPDKLADPPSLPRLSNQLFYSDGSGGDCGARVTINFRAKHHATWPLWLRPCGGEEEYWVPPIIPTGTYIEARANPNIHSWRPTAQTLIYEPDHQFFTVNDVDPLPTENCVTKTLATIDQGETGSCGTTPLSTVDDQYLDSELVFAQELEVRWSSVPIIDRKLLDSLEGTVNNTVWLGYPPESVRLSNWDIEEQSYFSRTNLVVRVDLMTLVLKFDIRTAKLDLTGLGGLTTEELLSRGIYNSRIGLWNRAWSDTPMYVENIVSGDRICLNWVPVMIKGSSESTCCNFTRPIHQPTCFDTIFTIPSCAVG